MITSVRLQNFRIYSDKTVEFESGTNLITGPNGIGKTTILEAIYMTLRGSSWRGSDESVIKHGAEWARVDVATSEGDEYTLKLDARSGRLTKSRQKNDSRITTTPPLVLFEPEFILTFTSSPDLRRSWVDDILEQQIPGYKQLSKDYRRALRQRNRLLKNGSAPDSIFVWDLKLSEYGAQIAKARSALIKDINTAVQAHYQALSGDSSVISLRYDHGFPLDVYATAFLAKLEENRQRDMLIGFTTRGPHREDIISFINNEPFSSTASRGEVRTLAMALKKRERELLSGDNLPIELYDDAFSELDSNRSNALINQQPYQRIVTSAEDFKVDAKKITL